MEQNFAIAAQWVLLALIATVLSIRLGISVAVVYAVMLEKGNAG
jgi:hypothetical protein